MPDAARNTVSARRDACDFCLYLLCCAGVVALAVWGAEESGYFWQWRRLIPTFFSGPDGAFLSSPLIQGLAFTLRVSAQAMALALFFGLAAACLRLAGGPVARALALGYVQCIRNTPLMVQILFIYFVIAPALGLTGEPSAVLALALFEGAYMAEIFRAGLLAVPSGQWEAALSLGLSHPRAVSSVILPQAVRHALPPLVSQSVSLVKDSSLASSIAVAELTLRGKVLISDTYMALEVWLAIAAVYLALALCLSGLAGWLRSRLSRGFRPA